MISFGRVFYTAYPAVFLVFLAGAGARADDADDAAVPSATPPSDMPTTLSNPGSSGPTASPGATTAPKGGNSASGGTVNAENTRMQSLVGSSSRWSAHFNLTYTGPAIATPFGSNAPNPLHQVPEPLVELAGTVSARYRLDPESTLSFGTGVLVYTPITDPHGWSVSDPYLDYNRLITTGPIHNYVTVGGTVWTDNQYFTQDGYRFGFNLNDESYHVFKSGLTVGLDLWAALNTFASGQQRYNPGQQDYWYIGGGPYAEFAFSDTLSLRSVIGITGDHTEATPGNAVVWENPYQTLGVGVQVIKPWYIYLYVIGTPYSGNLTSQNTGLGFNTIINLF